MRSDEQGIQISVGHIHVRLTAFNIMGGHPIAVAYKSAIFVLMPVQIEPTIFKDCCPELITVKYSPRLHGSSHFSLRSGPPRTQTTIAQIAKTVIGASENNKFDWHE